MNVLGIDTSSVKAAVAVVSSGEPVASASQISGKTVSNNLIALIHEALEQSRLTLENIDIIAVAQGPGSFTGLRVGLGTALGLSDATCKPVVGVGTLDAMAQTKAGWDEGYICPMIASVAGEVYTALYETKNGQIKKITDDMAISPESLAKMIDRPVIFIGDGFSKYSDTLRSMIAEKITVMEAPDDACARQVAAMAYRRAKTGEDMDETLAPRYVRRSQAEINWEKRYGSTY